jgi:hypothetical protein
VFLYAAKYAVSGSLCQVYNWDKNPTGGTEITPEMLEAGASLIEDSFNDVVIYQSPVVRVLASRVYQAMESARQKQRIESD